MRTLSMNTFSLKKIVIAVSCTCSVLALSGACALAQAPKSPAPAYQRTVLFNGEVQTSDSFPITVPSTNMNPATMRFFLPEGSVVKKGDVVLRVESQADSDVERVELELVQTRERGVREAADLEVKKIEAERALLTAKAALAKAKIDAALPKSQISALDFDKYQAERDRATRDLDVKQQGFENAQAAIQRKLEDNALAVKRLQIQIAFAKQQMDQAEVKAGRDGILIHGYDSFTGKRLDEGGHAMTGSSAGHIMGDGKLQVVAWVLEVDRPFLKLDQTVSVRFDAILEARLQGKIKRISGAPEPRAIWGSGKYFKVEIELPEAKNLTLMQGMSAQIEVEGSAQSAAQSVTKKNVSVPAKASAHVPQELSFEGEVLSRQSINIMPPMIQRVWMYNLVMLVPEGSKVTQGQPVAVFEANEVKTRLETNRSLMKEKERSLEKIRLDHAEAEKASVLFVSEAKSNAEKAARKAGLPKELVKRIDYEKLVLGRELFEKLAKLAEQQREAQSRSRTAEYRGLQSEIATLKQGVDLLEKGIRGLSVKAPRAGTIIHSTNYEGEKITNGSKVYMGMKVATLADPEKLFVFAKIPEAQSSLLKVGQAVAITVPGSSDVIAAKLKSFGVIYHGKSSSEPVIVRDVEIEFDQFPKQVKPGTAVQIKVNMNAQGNKQAGVKA